MLKLETADGQRNGSVTPANPVPVKNMVGGDPISSTNPMPSYLVDAAGNPISSGLLSDRTHNIDGELALTTASAMYGRVSDTVVKPARIDASTEAVMTIEYPHHEIHEGSMYHAHHNASGGSGTKATISLTTPNTTKHLHVVIQGRGNVESMMTIGEGATVTAASGTDDAPHNRNRNSANVSTAISAGSAGGAGFITTGGAVTSFGTILNVEHFGAGNRAGGDSRSEEWVLKANTTYAFEVESQAATSEVGININWYEHTDRN